MRMQSLVMQTVSLVVKTVCRVKRAMDAVAKTWGNAIKYTGMSLA